MSNLKRPREGESYEPCKRAQGLEYPDMGANVDDNVYPNRDTTQDMCPALPKRTGGSRSPLRMDGPPAGTIGPIKDISPAGLQETKLLHNDVEGQRPQVQPVSRKNAKSPATYVQPVFWRAIQAQSPVQNPGLQTTSRAQFTQAGLPMASIRPLPGSMDVSARRLVGTAHAGAPHGTSMNLQGSADGAGLQHVGLSQALPQPQMPPPSISYVHQQTQSIGVEKDSLHQTPIFQQAHNQGHSSQRTISGPLPPIGLFAPPKIQPPQQPGTQRHSREYQMNGMAKPRDNMVQTGTTSPGRSIPSGSNEPAKPVIQQEWLRVASKVLDWTMDILPGQSINFRQNIGPEITLIYPHFVLGMRSLDPKGRFEAWNKIIMLGRSLRETYPHNKQWHNTWAGILLLSREILVRERHFYEWIEKIDPADKVRILQEQTQEVRVGPTSAVPWYAGWTGPSHNDVGQQSSSNVAAPATPADMQKTQVYQEGDHPRTPHTLSGSRVDSPETTQAASLRQPAMPPFQSPLRQAQSTAHSAKIAPPQASDHARAVVLANQAQSQSKTFPVNLLPPTQTQKRKARPQKNEPASTKRVQTDKGQGGKMRHDMPDWMKELEKTYLANQAEIDEYYMEYDDLGMRSLNDNFVDKLVSWNAHRWPRKSDAVAPQQNANEVRKDTSAQVLAPEVQPLQSDAEIQTPVQILKERKQTQESSISRPVPTTRARPPSWRLPKRLEGEALAKMADGLFDISPAFREGLGSGLPPTTAQSGPPQSQSSATPPYTAYDEMIAEGAVQHVVADMKLLEDTKRVENLPVAPSGVQGGGVPLQNQYKAPQAQMLAPKLPVQTDTDLAKVQDLVAPGQASQKQTDPAIQTAGPKQSIQLDAQKAQQQMRQQNLIPVTDVVSSAPASSQTAPSEVSEAPQVTPPEQEKPSTIFHPKQEAQKMVHRQMVARNAALNKGLELPEAEHIIVSGINIAQLLDAGTNMAKIIKQITPLMTDPESLVEQFERVPDRRAQLNDDLAPPASPPTFINVPEEGWDNVEIIDEGDIRFWPGLEGLSDEYCAGVAENAFAGETRAEREAWEARSRAEYQRQMDMLDEMYGDNPFIGDF